MNKNKRTKELLFYLSNNKDFVQAEEIASLLHVSKKTVYRLVRDINAESQSPVIVSQRGMGYKLSSYSYFKKNNESGNRKSVNISPVERRNRILKRLLLVSPQGIKESEVFKDYFISSSVRTNDERVMKQVLDKYDLNLSIENSYMRITGSEVNIRQIIKELIDDREIVDLRQFTGNTDFNSELDVKFVLYEIRKIEDRLQSSLPYPYNVNLFSHIYILITRLRKAGSHADLNRRKVRKEDIAGKTFLYEISQVVVSDISHYLAQDIPDDEADTIFEYLVSSRFGDDLAVNNISTQVTKITNDLINQVSAKIGCNFIGINIGINNELEKHIEPLMKRLNNNIHINNNLLEQIKMEYTDLFNVIKDISKKIFPNYSLSMPDDNEIGYLTLYFAQAIESQPKHVNVVIMCATGIGTSELLRIKVENAFPNFNIVAVTSSNDLSVNKNNVDLIISTVKVSEQIKVPSVIVSALFTQQDQDLVAKAVNTMWRNKNEG